MADTSMCIIHHAGMNAHIKKRLREGPRSKPFINDTESLMNSLGMSGHSPHLGLIQAISEAAENYKQQHGQYPPISRGRVHVMLGWASSASSMVEYCTRSQQYWNGIIDRPAVAPILHNLLYDSKTLSYLTVTGRKWPIESPYFNNNIGCQHLVDISAKVDDIIEMRNVKIVEGLDNSRMVLLSLDDAKAIAKFARKGIRSEKEAMSNPKELATSFAEQVGGIKSDQQLAQVLAEGGVDEWEDMDTIMAEVYELQ